MFKLTFCPILVLIHVVNVFSYEKSDGNWVDPYDMTPSKEYLKYSDGKSSIHTHFDKDNYEKNTLTDFYFKRTINMLLNSASEDYTNSDMYSGHLFFKLSAEEYEFLKKFTEGTEDNVERVDKILEDILARPNYEYLQKYLESWFHKCLNFVLSREGIILIVVATYTFVIFKLFYFNFRPWQVFKFVLLNLFLFDFIFTWVNLYQKAQAKDLVQKLRYQDVPVECNPEMMNSWQFLTNMLSTEDACVEYYEARFEDIFYKVSPGVVLTEIFARTIQYPAKSIGKGFGELCYGIYGAFPWPLNIIILPICLLFFSLMTCIVLIFLFSTFSSKQMKLNFFHLISFSFGNDNRQLNQDTVSGNNLEKLLNITQHSRTFIEEIPVGNLKNTGTKPKILKIKEKGHKERKEVVENKQPKIKTEKSEEKADQKTSNFEQDRQMENKPEIGAGDT